MLHARRALIASALATPALAQSARPLRILVGFPPGSGLDLLARLLAEPMAARLGRPVLVDNRAGGGGRIAAEALARSPGDGDVLMAAPIVVPVFFPYLYANLPFDVAADIAPVAMLTGFVFALAVRRDHPARDLPSFIAWARQRGDAATFGSLSAGTPSHFLGVLFNRATGTMLRHIPYRGVAPLATALLAGEVDAGFPTTAGIAPQLQDGSLRALSVSGASRSLLAPAVPSFAELGPDLAEMGRAGLWYGLFAPGRTPAAVVAQQAAAALAALADPGLIERLRALDLPPQPAPPAAFAAIIEADRERWGPLIRGTGFTLQD
jgi:tripartite-type tricarboxylate transporter receptor subunit TctC